MKEENANQKEFRMAINDLLATSMDKKHTFETKNDYKDYPCECGATNNRDGSTCFRHKTNLIKEKFYTLLSTPNLDK